MSADLLHQLQAQEPAPGALRMVAQVELEAAGLNGTYTAALIARRGPDAAARVQLLPSVGSKLLDLSINSERIAGYFPAAGIRLEHTRADGAPARHLLTFLAASVLEAITPMSGRLRGVSRTAGGSRTLVLDGALEGCRVRVTLDSEGRVTARCYTLRQVSWKETVHADRREFRGRGFAWTLRDVVESTLPDPGPAIFELELPY